MDVKCPYCNALHWGNERLTSSSHINPKFGSCCDSGRVQLPLLREPPTPLQHLLNSQDEQAKKFHEDIWKYNRAFSFTSLGVLEDHTLNDGQSTPIFQICGELYHYSGALTPHGSTTPRYTQVYIYEPFDALWHHLDLNSDLDRGIMQCLQNLLDCFNPYTHIYKSAYNVMAKQHIPQVSVRLQLLPGQDRRTYNQPTTSEFAIIMPGTEGYDEGRDIVLRLQGQGLHRISDLHPAYAPLQYPLLFIYGELGWSEQLKLQDKEDLSAVSNSCLSQTRFTAFRIQYCHNEAQTLLHAGRLFTRYIVDMWASADQNRLRFIRHNQSKIRAELYSGLEDAISHNNDGEFSWVAGWSCHPPILGGPET
ncbi:hypothetical protein FA15DRAFT_683628 [Coprinopsis marcescibilis]|uniref:Helitron helicase-like domain-containing protein n=1 Tax=Coprinopsis marcescibilis TaxID=230819 RepID=A0A5C3KAE4_COPMA|nr:hypothetical protein FA15DRAFT_683628 [Coprinopsis marcescibilis]